MFRFRDLLFSVFLLLVLLPVSSCSNSQEIPEPPADDDDTSGGDDDDSAVGDDDDSTAGDDDDSSLGDDDDSSAGDDDDSSMGDDDDSAAGDDDDSASGGTVDILQVHISNLTNTFAGYLAQSLPELASPLDAAGVPGVVQAALPSSHSYMSGCSVDASAQGFFRCTAPAGDFGGSSIVDGRSGELIFAGATHWMGVGSLAVPAPTSLGPMVDLIPTGFVPGQVQSQYFDLDGLAPVLEAEGVLNQTLASAYVATWINGEPTNAYVWLHPYSVGVFDPTQADWIVLLVK